MSDNHDSIEREWIEYVMDWLNCDEEHAKELVRQVFSLETVKDCIKDNLDLVQADQDLGILSGGMNGQEE